MTFDGRTIHLLDRWWLNFRPFVKNVEWKSGFFMLNWVRKKREKKKKKELNRLGEYYIVIMLVASLLFYSDWLSIKMFICIMVYIWTVKLMHCFAAFVTKILNWRGNQTARGFFWFYPFLKVAFNHVHSSWRKSPASASYWQPCFL